MAANANDDRVSRDRETSQQQTQKNQEHQNNIIIFFLSREPSILLEAPGSNTHIGSVVATNNWLLASSYKAVS